MRSKATVVLAAFSAFGAGTIHSRSVSAKPVVLVAPFDTEDYLVRCAIGMKIFDPDRSPAGGGETRMNHPLLRPFSASLLASWQYLVLSPA